MRPLSRHILLALAVLLLLPVRLCAEKYSINGVFTIEIGDEFELQKNSNVEKTKIGELTVLRGDRIVFQQYGLNANFHWALNTYSRIIILTGSGEEDGTYPACNQGIELSPSDRSVLLESARNDAKPWKITQGPSLSNTEINNHPCLKITYQREGGHGGTYVDSYFFFNDNQFARILTSYAIPDERIYKSALNSVVESFSWNNPHFSSEQPALSDEQAEQIGLAIIRVIKGLVLLCVILFFIIRGIVRLIKRSKSKNKSVEETEKRLQDIVRDENIKLPPLLPNFPSHSGVPYSNPAIHIEDSETNVNEEDSLAPIVTENPVDYIIRVQYSLASQNNSREYLYYLSPDKDSVVYPHRFNKGKIRGYSEEMFELLLRKAFSNVPLDVFGNVNLKFSNTAKSYEPDIAIIANNGHSLRIDIEIDEPYSLVSRVPIHYTEDNSDQVRDMIIRNAGWVVIRFAEEQIVKQPMACISSIARLLIQIDSSFVPESCSISEFVKPIKRWTKAEAELMAANNYRETYLEITDPVSPQQSSKEDSNPLTDEEIAAKKLLHTSGIWGDGDKKQNQKYNARNVSDRDARIEFFPENHTYILDGAVNLLPATTVIAKHFPAFDGPRVAEKMVRKGNGKTVQELLDEFSYKGALAREVGTFMHEQIEKRILGEDINNIYQFEFKSKTVTINDEISIEKEMSQFNSFISKHNITPYRSEWRIFDERYGIAGTIDLLAKSRDRYVMYDWKRSLKVVSASANGTYTIQGNGFATGLGQLSHLDDSAFNHYCLQQNLYRYILKTSYGINVKQMFLVVFHKDYQNYYMIPVPPMDKEISVILNNIEN